MFTLEAVEQKIVWSARGLSLIGLIGLLCLSLITVGAVLLRAIFKISILGIYDASELIVAVVVAACLPLASAERGHIAVTVLGAKLGRVPNGILGAFASGVSCLFFAIFAVFLWKYVGDLIATHETTWIVHIPLYPWWILAAILVSCCVPLEMLGCLTQLVRLVTGKDKQINRE